MLVCHLYAFFGEIFAQIFCPFLLGFLIVEFYEFFGYKVLC